MPNVAPLGFASELLWGTPAEPKHDTLRFSLKEAQSMLLAETCDENNVPSTPSPLNPSAPEIGPPIP